MFITRNEPSDILDTALFDGSNITLKEFHAARTIEAYHLLNRVHSLESILGCYNEIENELILQNANKKLVRIVFAAEGLKYTFACEALTQISEPVVLQIGYDLPTTSGSGLQNYKWVDRKFWNQLLERKSEKVDDIISINEKNEVVESTRFNLFAFDPEQKCAYTPSLQSGCINGVFRRSCMHWGVIKLPDGNYPLREKSIPAETLKNYQLFVANSVRGVLSATLV